MADAPLSPQEALIYTMVITSAADSDMTDSELRMMGDLVQHLPVFDDFEAENVTRVATACAAILAEDEGLETALSEIKAALPPRLRETAYSLACDVVAADRRPAQEELRLLEMIRHRLDLDRLTAAAIERAAGARYAKA